MARCRNIKPGFFANELLAELPPLARLLFAGLWCFADRDGRLEDRPKRIKAQILPFDDFDVDKALDQLTRGDDPFIVRYQVGSNRFIQIIKFLDNQTPHHTEKPSVIPVPPDNPQTSPGVRQPPLEVRGSEGGISSRKGDARGKQKRQQISAASVPVPAGFEAPEVRTAIADWLTYKIANGAAYKDPSYLGRKVAEFLSPAAFIAAVNSSIGNNYNGIYPAKDFHGKPAATRVGPGQRHRE